MTMMIPTSKNGDGSLSPVVWSCETRVENPPSCRRVVKFISLSVKREGRETNNHLLLQIEGQWVKRMTAVKSHVARRGYLGGVYARIRLWQKGMLVVTKKIH